MSGNLNLCRVPGCITYLDPGQLFCAEHWKRIPKWRRNAILSALRSHRQQSYRRLLKEAIAELQGVKS